MNTSQPTVLITDYAWPDLHIERQIIEAAGLRMVAGPAQALPAEAVTALVQEHQPASILTCWARVDANAIAASSALRHVGRIGVGLDNIDVAACTARGVPVTNVPDYCVEEVSDHVLAMTLAWARGVLHFDREVRAGRWQPAGATLRRVADLTIGVMGHGRIGQATARKFSALGCRVLVHTAHPPAGDPRFVALPHLLAQSDVLALHVPLTEQTRHIIHAQNLTLMKSGSFLVNASRGGLVDSAALADALASGQLSGAGLDVMDSEPEVPPALLAQPGVIFTPHVGFSSTASLAELRRRAAEQAVRVLSGQEPQHRCNPIR